MAVTKILPIHVTIAKSVDYICNPAKTEDCLYIHSEHCFPQTAALEFQHHLRQARAGGNTIGRHLIQSFAPGEVLPETAHAIGKKLADEILGGEYAYVMATHVDRGHIHNHFVWGAANIVTHKRYRSNKNTYHQIREISDRLCKENSLSVIVPHGVGKSYTEYNAEKEGMSWKANLKTAIDNILSESADFEDFVRRMESHGYEIKRGKHISFRAPEQERFTRAKSLGNDYDEEALKLKISRKSATKAYRETVSTVPDMPIEKPETLQRLIDIENNEKCQQSEAYENWAKVHNLKLSAATLIALKDCGDDYETFEKKYVQVLHEKMEAASAMNAIDARVKELAALKPNIAVYHRTKNVYQQYRNVKNREQFWQANKDDITAHRNAKKALEGIKPPIPTVQAIDKEITVLKASREETSANYKRLSEELKQLEIIRKNIYDILQPNKSQQQVKDNGLNI